jgi:hypothetical protein
MSKQTEQNNTGTFSYEFVDNVASELDIGLSAENKQHFHILK